MAAALAAQGAPGTAARDSASCAASDGGGECAVATAGSSAGPFQVSVRRPNRAIRPYPARSPRSRSRSSGNSARADPARRSRTAARDPKRARGAVRRRPGWANSAAAAYQAAAALAAAAAEVVQAAAAADSQVARARERRPGYGEDARAGRRADPRGNPRGSRRFRTQSGRIAARGTKCRAGQAPPSDGGSVGLSVPA